MKKKVAVLIVNPVNGLGLFQYLEPFFENGISYQTFAVADSTQIKTNSGIVIQTDDVVANLKNREDEFDALVFACGDAIPKFSENADKSYNQDMLLVMKNFSDKGKIMIGHCAAGLLFDGLDSAKGRKVTLHPFVRPIVQNVVGSDEKVVVDENYYTAQTENSIALLIPKLIDVLK